MHDRECRCLNACLILISTSLRSSHALERLYCGQMYQMHKAHMNRCILLMLIVSHVQ